MSEHGWSGEAIRERSAKGENAMTKEQAIELANTGWWERTTAEEAALFQLYEPLLCMPFAKFHEGAEKLLGRPIWTHEFANLDRIKAEAEGRAEKPTFEQILALIPEEKRLVVNLG